MYTETKLREILDAGYRHFDKAQYHDAMACFSDALHMEPGCREAKLAYNQTIQMVVPRYHFSMLDDRRRNEVYDAAIRKAVAGNRTVLDVGTGSGLLSMMGVRAGAEHVYTCEVIEPIAEIARTVIADNGFAERITVINKRSSDLVLGEDIPERLDLLVTETVDSALLGEGIVPIIRHAREHLLRDGARVVPGGAQMYAALIESEKVFAMNHVSTASGFDVSPFNQLSTDGAYPVRLAAVEHRLLCEPVQICAFDFEADVLESRQFEFSLPVEHDGTCHAVATWFDLHLDREITLSSCPDQPHTHWKQGIKCFGEPIPVKAGSKVQLSVRQDLTRVDFDLLQQN